MIASSTQDRVIEFWAPRTAIGNGVPADKNYYREIGKGGKEFAQDNPANQVLYTPIQQGSLIIVQDESKAYTYIIDSNPGELHGQTGHWVEM